MLSQLAWFDEFFLEEPEIAALVEKGRDFSLDDQRFVIARQRELIWQRFCPRTRPPPRLESIELSTSPFYHPILPLVCDTNIWRRFHARLAPAAEPLPPSRRRQRTTPARPRSARKSFWRSPQGVWPSEGSVSEEVIAIAPASACNGWPPTKASSPAPSACRSCATATAASRTLPPKSSTPRIATKTAQTAMNLIFRDHTISDLIGFVYSGMPPQDAAHHLIQNIKESAQPVLRQGQDAIVPIILDGENAWEYYPNPAANFSAASTTRCTKTLAIEAVTVSEAIERHRNSAR